VDERKLHPREEPYRWAIERLDQAFGRERVRVTPRQHHHVIKVAIAGDGGGRVHEITLRSPTYDINRQKEREAFLAHWIAEAREESGGTGKGRGEEAREPAGAGARGKGRSSSR
jgi:hypothetical protein